MSIPIINGKKPFRVVWFGLSGYSSGNNEKIENLKRFQSLDDLINVLYEMAKKNDETYFICEKDGVYYALNIMLLNKFKGTLVQTIDKNFKNVTNNGTIQQRKHLYDQISINENEKELLKVHQKSYKEFMFRKK